MDLATVQYRLSTDPTYSPLRLDQDVTLIISNCIRYNGANSDLGKYAQMYKLAWANLCADLLHYIAIEAEGKEVQVSSTRALNPFFRSVWEEMTLLDTYGTFAAPVRHPLHMSYTPPYSKL